MENTVIERLMELRDENYREFQAKLMPTVDINTVIGIRVPEMRKFAKTLTEEEKREFIKVLPHKYYDENNLHGFIIDGIKDFDRCIAELDRFLPYVNNWATCDLMSPKIFAKKKQELLPHIKRWLASGKTYTVRFGIEMLMSHYLDGDFKPCYLEMVSKVKSDDYYVKMMVAWYFATALAKQYEATVPYIEGRCLDIWVHNKSIQKAVESYRITAEQKEYLKGFKVKKNA